MSKATNFTVFSLFWTVPDFPIWVTICVAVFDSIKSSATNFLLPSVSTRHEFCHGLVILILPTS